MSIQAILAASQSVARMQVMQSAKSQMEISANIMRTESKQDGGNQDKLDKADALDKQSNNMMGNIMSEIADMNETLKPDEDAKEEEAKKEEAETKPPKTDTVVISDAAKQLSTENNVKPIVAEPVTYKADGSARPSTPAKAATKFETTV